VATHPVPEFVSANDLARWTTGLLVVTIVLSLVGIGAALLQVQLFSRVFEDLTQAEKLANRSRLQLVGAIQVFVYVATALAFLRWFHRVHGNLPGLGGRDLKYTPGWAAGGFFVPVLNLFRPLQVMREVWHASDPSRLEQDLAPDGPTWATFAVAKNNPTLA